jgi:hypothetical protein
MTRKDGVGKLLLRPPAVLLQQQRQGKETNQSHGEALTGKENYRVLVCVFEKNLKILL